MTSRTLCLLLPGLALAQAMPGARGTVRLGSTGEESTYAEPGAETEETPPPSSEAVTVQPGDVHVVQAGETLWSLAQRYLGSPDQWPRLWSYNPEITNPHYIYPGENIRLSPGVPIVATTEPPPEAEPAPEAPAAPLEIPAESGPTLRTTERMASDVLFLRQHGFLEEAEFSEAGRIVASKEEKQMLATGDEAYVQLPRAARSTQPGTRYAAYRMVRELRHPKTDERIGYLVEVLGTLELKSMDPNKLARVVITDADNAIERESTLVGPLRKRFHQIQPVRNETQVDGTLVGSLVEAEIIGTDALVFVDRGQAQGVRAGNRFLILSRGDGLRPADEEAAASFPAETTGEILVLEARHSVSVGYVTRLSREARVGAAVRMPRGY
jgi:LysM repeat protein